MLVANAVVDTDQPRLQVGENQMDDRQVLLGNLWITTLGNSEVLITYYERTTVTDGEGYRLRSLFILPQFMRVRRLRRASQLQQMRTTF